MTWKYYRAVCELMFKWLNRRSQRKSYTWAKFGDLWGRAWQLPRPSVVEKVGRTAQGEFVLEPTPSVR